MISLDRDKWLVREESISGARATMFCFPYAGGGASVYRAWIGRFQPEMRVCAVQLPGRETRLSEQPFRSMTALTAATAEALKRYTGTRFIFFGHSMGAVLAFEMVRWLRRHSLPLPSMLVVSGRTAPQLSRPYRDTVGLGDAELVQRLRQIGGSPAEVLNDSEFMTLLLPAIRADFECVETYSYEKEDPLEIPIVAIGGSADPEVGVAELDAWGEQTSAGFSRLVLPGDHFFVTRSPQLVTNVLRQYLLTHWRARIVADSSRHCAKGRSPARCAERL